VKGDNRARSAVTDLSPEVLLVLNHKLSTFKAQLASRANQAAGVTTIAAGQSAERIPVVGRLRS
jgi:hypothetical protein